MSEVVDLKTGKKINKPPPTDQAVAAALRCIDCLGEALDGYKHKYTHEQTHLTRQAVRLLLDKI